MNDIQTLLSTNPLQEREDLIAACKTIVDQVTPFFTDSEQSGLNLGSTTTHYGPKIAEMEALSRLLWGIFPLLTFDDNQVDARRYFDAIRTGTDPLHENYWGNTLDYDQRVVEMAVYGYGMALLGDKFWSHFSELEAENVYQWLSQAETALVPDNNWHFFPIMVQVGFKVSGKPYSQAAIDERFQHIEEYYLADGWYCDGIGRPRDYYISMGFHFYSLFYVKYMKSVDTDRCIMLTERAKLFTGDFLWMFSCEGDAIGFGRSLCYRFAQAAFWSAVAFSDEDIADLGLVKGVLLRHLRFWFKKPIFDNAGLLSIGYHYSNLIMAEDYNAPGSPYWALKVFVVLALDEKHQFWQVPESALPSTEGKRLLTHANQILLRDDSAAHAWMLSSGQLELNNYVNTESKYTKFAYSNVFGFTLERGRFDLKHCSCDSTLLLGEGDGYYRGRREHQVLRVSEHALVSHWNAWQDVSVTTWLVAIGRGWHVRVHHIDSSRELEAVEGGFSLPYDANTQVIQGDDVLKMQHFNRYVDVVPLYSATGSTLEQVITPPNTNILYPTRCIIPYSHVKLGIGKTVIAHAFYGAVSKRCDDIPKFHVRDDGFVVEYSGEILEFDFPPEYR